jgi:hypothetical protein
MTNTLSNNNITSTTGMSGTTNTTTTPIPSSYRSTYPHTYSPQSFQYFPYTSVSNISSTVANGINPEGYYTIGSSISLSSSSTSSSGYYDIRSSTNPQSQQ